MKSIVIHPVVDSAVIRCGTIQRPACYVGRRGPQDERVGLEADARVGGEGRLRGRSATRAARSP